MAKFTNKDLRLKDGQKVTWGTDLDSNIWWDDANAELRLDTVISGVYPTKPDHLTPRFYVDDELATTSGSLQDQINNLTMDHGELNGLADDDHLQYVPTNADRGFTSTVSGIDPIQDYHLATKWYIDNELATLSGGIVQDHGNLTGLGDDDHTQYSLVDGTRGFTGTVAGIDPTADNHLTTKSYVDLAIQGLDWQDSVLDFHTPSAGLPAGPTTGDRYIADDTGNGWTDKNIYEWDGSQWDETVPNEGTSTWVESEDALYVFNGTDWVRFGSTVTHNNTNGLQGGTSDEYYHLTSAQFEALTDNNANVDDASSQHHHDSRYYTESEMDTTVSGLQDQIDNINTDLGNYVTLDGDETITGNKTFDNTGVTTFLGDVFFNGIEITMSGTTLNTESGAVFNYDDSTTMNYDGTSNYSSTAVTNNAGDTNYQNGSTVDYESGSTLTHENGSVEYHESGSEDHYLPGSIVTYSGAGVTYEGDTVVDVNGDTVTNFNDGSETIFHPGSEVTFSGTTNFDGPITGLSHGDLEDLGADDHTQYILVDGSRGFTGTVSGIDPVLDSDLATKAYVDSADRPRVYGNTPVANGADNVVVSFTDIGTSTYTVLATLENTADSPPSIYAFIVSAKTSSGFTVTFMGDMDSANYVLDWAIIYD